MNAIIKKTDHDYLIELHVIPNSKNQNIILDNEQLRIHLTSAPRKNKANKELLKMFKKKLKLGSDQIRLISGAKSTDKIISVSFSEQTFVEEIKKMLLS